MLGLTAPESGSLGSRFDAGFHRPHFDPQNGVLEMARLIAHHIQRSNSTPDGTPDPSRFALRILSLYARARTMIYTSIPMR